MFDTILFMLLGKRYAKWRAYRGTVEKIPFLRIEIENFKRRILNEEEMIVDLDEKLKDKELAEETKKQLSGERDQISGHLTRLNQELGAHYEELKDTKERRDFLKNLRI